MKQIIQIEHNEAKNPNWYYWTIFSQDRGAQFSEAGLNGALMKRKKQPKHNNKYKMEQLSITKVLEAHLAYI